MEASLLLPILLAMVMLLLFFALYSYQKTMLVQVSSAAAERAAYTWDNSRKAEDGSFAAGETDSLYWRIKDDRLLAELTGAVRGGASEEATVQLPGSDASTEDKASLPVAKLLHTAARIPSELSGALNYRYALRGRRVTVQLKRVLNLPVIDSMLNDKAQPAAVSRSLVAEPVEFIRTVELMRYLGSKFQRDGTGAAGGMKKTDASAVMGRLADK
ncbi:TadE/TadG family type IV pilus assembly protein [Paenibacillus spiritus]|uniref:TadE/TadG family type IV pilus assembly protein n=1 Tax=Paenibacillus spiritus TaxID=2496557 RepID=UPI001CC5D24E|nr:TadE/TadG family type IV pilus assembly protein [Paenibacillus spiritus]